MKVNETEYEVIKLLGKGKGGYSYLVENDGKQYVLKQIHHEPCDYYIFGNKIEAERNETKDFEVQISGFQKCMKSMWNRSES